MIERKQSNSSLGNRQKHRGLKRPALGVTGIARSILGVNRVSLRVTMRRLVTLRRVRHQTTQPVLVARVVMSFRRLTANVKSGGGGNRTFGGFRRKRKRHLQLRKLPTVPRCKCAAF